MPIKPLTTVAAVFAPLALAGALAVSADSHDASGAGRQSKSAGGAAPAVPRRPTQPQVVSTDQIQPSVVRIVGRYGSGESYGTGFVVDAEKRLVVTNAHVVAGVSAIKATAGGTQVPARLVATAPCDDLAVLELASLPAGTRALPLADAAGVKASQHVRAFGFPESLDVTQMSVTEGSVSAAGVAGTPGGDLPNYPSTIQHQAPINPGNSGGPLVDDQGRVVGVNSLSSSSTQGQYYAISSTHLKTILPTLVAGKSKDDMGWELTQAKNVSFSWHDDDAQRYRDIVAQEQLGEHMYVVSVRPNSPAAEAGLTPGDLVTAVEDSPVGSFGDICDVIQSRGPGQSVKVSAIAVDSSESDPFTPLKPLALKLG